MRMLCRNLEYNTRTNSARLESLKRFIAHKKQKPNVPSCGGGGSGVFPEKAKRSIFKTFILH